MLGRWTSPDTIVPDPSNPQSLNRYSWVLDNPLRHIDPTGHFTDEELAEYLGFSSVEEMYQSDLWALWGQDADWLAMLRSAECKFGSVLVGEFSEWDAGRMVSQQSQAMFVKTRDGQLALWDINTQTTVGIQDFFGAQNWALFQSNIEHGFGDYTLTRHYKNGASASLPGPSFKPDWTEGLSGYIDIYEKIKAGRVILDTAGLLVGGATVLVTWPAAVADPEPLTKTALVSGAIALTVAFADTVSNIAEGGWIKDRTLILSNGPRPDPTYGYAFP